MSKCPSCNKFAGLETQEPEVQSIDIDETGHVSAEVRLVRVSTCCGDEMKEAYFSLEVDVGVDEHTGEGHELQVEEESTDIIEEGGGRYAKSYYGVQVSATVTCSCGKLEPVTVEMTDKVSASGMDELN